VVGEGLQFVILWLLQLVFYALQSFHWLQDLIL